MAAEMEVGDRVCLKHPTAPAVARCAACMKPACAACVVISANQKYCSQECADKSSASRERVNDMADRAKARARAATIRAIVLLLVLIALVGGFLYYYRTHKGTVDQKLEQLKQDADIRGLPAAPK